MMVLPPTSSTDTILSHQHPCRLNDFLATTFPKLRICSHSQHSLAKVQKLYPDLDPEIMQKLYGFASSREEKDLWNKLVITKGRYLSK